MEVFKQKMGDVLKILSEAISEGIIMVNEDHYIVATNRSANTMFGYKTRELIDKPLSILIPNKYQNSHESHVSSFFNKGEHRQMGQGRDLYGVKKNKDLFPVEVGLNPFDIYGHKYVMALVIDISTRKTQEKQIQELNLKLEDRIAERTIKLNKTVLELKSEIYKRKKAEVLIKESLKRERELNELKTKFLSLVSHEFKTPLGGILTSASLIGKYKTSEDQAKREKHINTITNKVRYLNNILIDFLSIEKLESGKSLYKIKNFSLDQLITEVIYDTNMILKEGQKINYPHDLDGITLNSDERILELILFNILNNAIKYSPENKSIDISTSFKKDKLIITIKDYGIGIPEEEQKFIFNRYFRAENALLDQGTGIGLNIAKSHLENLGGTIYFESQEGIGSSFTVEIPLETNFVKL
ncbi:MAG TPA: PAS domain-containing sensor histidine kinase [Gillisia sp.]|nr:PAS domain-containing sensor histidine kinase [Gillisia sp.]